MSDGGSASVEALRKWLTEQSLQSVAREIGCKTESILRYIHGAPVRRGTIALITLGLAARAHPPNTTTSRRAAGPRRK